MASLEAETWFPGRHQFVGEPQFVPRPDAGAEDDGWLLACVFDSGERRRGWVPGPRARVAAHCSVLACRGHRGWRINEALSQTPFGTKTHRKPHKPVCDPGCSSHRCGADRRRLAASPTAARSAWELQRHGIHADAWRRLGDPQLQCRALHAPFSASAWGGDQPAGDRVREGKAAGGTQWCTGMPPGHGGWLKEQSSS